MAEIFDPMVATVVGWEDGDGFDGVTPAWGVGNVGDAGEDLVGWGGDGAGDGDGVVDGEGSAVGVGDDAEDADDGEDEDERERDAEEDLHGGLLCDGPEGWEKRIAEEGWWEEVVLLAMSMGHDRKAIWSIRLRLHSCLRQSGRVFDLVVYGTAEAVPLRG